MFRPAPKRVEKVMGKYDFDGSDPDDLPFKKGELLTVVSKVIIIIATIVIIIIIIIIITIIVIITILSGIPIDPHDRKSGSFTWASCLAWVSLFLLLSSYQCQGVR